MAHILLIEPDRVLATTYFESLSAAGHNVMIAVGAQTAVMTADRQLPDVIVLELQLVEHSGIEFLYELRSYPEWQNIPVILHTQVPPAEFNDTAKIMRQELGVQDYLYKPHTTLKQLLIAIQEQLPVVA